MGVNHHYRREISARMEEIREVALGEQKGTINWGGEGHSEPKRKGGRSGN